MNNPDILGAVGGGDENLFDPDTFVTSSPLNGRRGVIAEAGAIRHNYGGKIAEEVTALRIVVLCADLEKPRVNLIAAGGLKPSDRPSGAPTIAGAFLTGGKIDKKSNIADFLNGLKAAGFPVAQLGARGFDALQGADITWRALEKPQGKGQTKTYDIPSEFHGYVTGTALDELLQIAGKAPNVEASAAASAGVAAAGANASVSVSAQDNTALKAELASAVLAALQVAPGNFIPRGQLSIKLQPAFKDHPQRVQALTLLLKDETLAGIPGIEYDKKVVRLSAGAPTPEQEQASEAASPEQPAQEGA